MPLKLRQRGNGSTAPARRGRPPKFGRPSQILVMTLPKDVVLWLRSLHTDPAAAVVSLYERASRGRTHARLPRTPIAELVPLPAKRALIVVEPQLLRNVEGVATIPLADGRAFLALGAARGLADLELAVIDRLKEIRRGGPEWRKLYELQRQLERWRKQPRMAFVSRSIILAEHRAVRKRRRASVVSTK